MSFTPLDIVLGGEGVAMAGEGEGNREVIEDQWHFIYNLYTIYMGHGDTCACLAP